VEDIFQAGLGYLQQIISANLWWSEDKLVDEFILYMTSNQSNYEPDDHKGVEQQPAGCVG
jgi:hypothetical protein